MSVESDLRTGLQGEVLEEAGREVAEDWMEEAKDILREEEQGAHLLVEGKPDDAPEGWPVEGFFTDVEEIGDKFVFRIQHPVAPLHEKGGHIEPEYAQALAMGWTRDGFYSALQDCEEWVTRKNYMRESAYTVRREYQ